MECVKIRDGVQVPRKESHTHIYLNYTRVKFLSYEKKKKNHKFFFREEKKKEKKSI